MIQFARIMSRTTGAAIGQLMVLPAMAACSSLKQVVK
jgi:hypothetical protein